ncbi:NADH:ubiquinone reductase (Na(+)-transporting) subunit F [Pseudonocardia sp.]|uniref:NADH:ubiquinone reductase (Na(+)-transporting) subunit F n=1 Tax=Pseudonocardia sp. TaxID=60912 RepID=UPI003D12308D
MSETFTITIEPLEREVECRSDQPILDACLRAGVWLPHACTHGTCGTCKVDVLDGDVEHNDASDFALMEFERNEGKTLVCVATPSSDVTIEADVEFEEGVTHHPVQDYTGTVAALDDIARATRRLVIDLDHDMPFNPGQYLAIDVPGKGVTRTYSMANPPSEPRRVELQVRRTPGGLGTDGWIFKDLAVGDTVTLSGPYGRFFLRAARPQPMILIGGGTGLAPLKSIVRHVLEGGLEQRIHLYQGARSRDDLYDVEFFERLADKHPEQFTYRPCLSDDEWDGPTGMVTDVVAADFETCRGHTAYLCGPPPMVEAALKTLMKKRLFPKDIYREDFFDASDKATGGVRSPLLKG